MNRKHLLLIVALTALLALVGGNAAAAPDAAESEPNDTLATADPLTIGDVMSGQLLTETDIDYFKFSAPAGKVLNAITCGEPDSVFESARLRLHNAAGTIIAGDYEEYLEVITLPGAGDYYLSLDNGEYYFDNRDYALTTWYRTGPYEPNDTRETGTPVTYGVINAAMDDRVDRDHYRLQAQAGDVLDLTLAADVAYGDRMGVMVNAVGTERYLGNLELYGAEGTDSVHGEFVVPFDGAYDIFVGETRYNTEPPCTEKGAPTPYTVTLARRSLYVTAATAGNAGGMAFTPSDLMVRDAAGQWRMAFDGSDVGIVKPLQAAEWTNDGALLLALSAPQNVPGVGQVAAADILRFTPAQLGANTQGTLALWLDGSDVGLAAAGEKIDALAFSEDGRLLVSLTGSGVVPKHLGGTVAVRDEDLIEFVPTQMGPNTLGTWLMRLDGSLLPKMGAEDVRGAFLPLVDDYNTPPHSAYNYLVTVENDYTFRACCYSNVTAKAGDIIHARLHFYFDNMDELDMSILLRAADLHFPRKITGYADGPGWN